jgi:hypothetical protein
MKFLIVLTHNKVIKSFKIKKINGFKEREVSIK